MKIFKIFQKLPASFPQNPKKGSHYHHPNGQVYVFNGFRWKPFAKPEQPKSSSEDYFPDTQQVQEPRSEYFAYKDWRSQVLESIPENVYRMAYFHDNPNDTHIENALRALYPCMIPLAVSALTIHAGYYSVLPTEMFRETMEVNLLEDFYCRAWEEDGYQCEQQCDQCTQTKGLDHA